MISQQNISATTAMGATLLVDGVTFRVWAPRAQNVHLVGDYNLWKATPDSLLKRQDDGTWTGFVPGMSRDATYKFHVAGSAATEYKRDPYARDLTFNPAHPNCNCLVREPSDFPWHDAGFRPPAFSDLIIYQLHIGAFFVSQGHAMGKFLDVAEKIPYLATLGINAIEPLPIDEFPSEYSLGYNGTDYFSPETEYGVGDVAELRCYLQRINVLLESKGQPPYQLSQLMGTDNQLRAMIDLCHLYGIAVILDVVYNHAGGGFDSSSMYFMDEMPRGNNNDSLYFTDQGYAGGLVYAYWNGNVRQFLIDNAAFYLREYHADGFRFDEVSTIDRHGGWRFCQDLTNTLRFLKPQAIQIAEFWPVTSAVVTATEWDGAGFDATWNDGLRESLRSVVSQAVAGAGAALNLDAVAFHLQAPGFENSWRAIQSLEDHDIVKEGKSPRLALLADPSNSRSWYARSRSRTAMGLLLTAPGIPMIFMGQEFLEDKQWSDNPSSNHRIWWEGLNQGQRPMKDHLRFTQELVQLRRRLPALRGPSIRVFHVHNANRIIAIHRWLEGSGQDVIVVASFNEHSAYDYEIGFPSGGTWSEVFNSDVYDNWVNPMVTGNGGAVTAAGPGRHGFNTSARLVIPANAILVFVRQPG